MGIPLNYRHMEGFGVHTFKLINKAGRETYVKFHWKPKCGECSSCCLWRAFESLFAHSEMPVRVWGWPPLQASVEGRDWQARALTPVLGSLLGAECEGIATTEALTIDWLVGVHQSEADQRS